MTKKYIFRKLSYVMIFLLVGNLSLQAQTVQIDFPHFAGKAYSFWVLQGDKKDTISVGILDKKGRATLKLPAKYSNYKGMSQWMLTDGGGLDLVINKENFTVGSSEEAPNESNIKYSGSPENTFLVRQFQKQRAIFAKIDAMRMATQAYGAKDPIYSVFEKELKNQEKMFEVLQTETAQNPLYAARFRQISDFLMGIGRKLYTTEDEKAKALNEFVTKELDIDVVYTSNNWNNTIEGWMDLQVNVIKDDTQLLADTQLILSRISSNEVYTAFAEKIVGLYIKNVKDSLLDDLSVTLKQSNKLVNPGSRLQRLTSGKIGQMAPKLVGFDKKFEGNKTVLVFYETGCGNCEREMQELKAKYFILKEKGVLLISIAADKEIPTYEKNASDFQWENKLCDYQGFDGQNFKNYGVIGTPTFIVIDENGKITGRYAQLKEVLPILE